MKPPRIVLKYKRVLGTLRAANVDQVLKELVAIAKDALKVGVEITDYTGYDVKWRYTKNLKWYVET